VSFAAAGRRAGDRAGTGRVPRVIKIERYEGDFARGYDVAAHRESSHFVWTNGSKESVALDIKLPVDLALLKRMPVCAAAELMRVPY